MAALVAWPRRGGKEGSGSQCWHFIEGGQEGDQQVRHANRGEDHTIPISRAYMRGPCMRPSFHPAHKRWESYRDTQLSVPLFAQIVLRRFCAERKVGARLYFCADFAHFNFFVGIHSCFAEKNDH